MAKGFKYDLLFEDSAKDEDVSNCSSGDVFLSIG